MTHAVDIERLSAILREAAHAEIMPRFRRLGEADVREKTSATDLVTEADEAAERLILARCRDLWPHAVFIGEESVAADERLLAGVATADLAIVVDPIDGTANFAAGAPLFAVMAAVVRKGETVAGIIYDPLGDDWIIAERGAGAFTARPGGERARIAVASPVPFADMVGVASHAYFEPEERGPLLANLSGVRVLANYRCAGHEYRLAATGHIHFNVYSKLMPWDHLAGALILSEGGGHVRRLDGSPYLASHVEGGLIAACDEASWHAVAERVAAARR